MAICSTATLIEQACANNFLTAANDVLLYRAIKHQLLCNISAGGGGGGGVTQFIQLTDVPNSYAGQALLSVRVNAAETGLEFFSIPAPAPDVTKFESADIPLDGASTAYTIPHGLGSTPAMLNVVLVCTVNDAGTGYLAGDEIDLPGWFNNTVLQPAFAVTRNATNVIVSLGGGAVLVGNETTFTINTRDGTGLANPTTFNSFALKVYAWF